MDIQEVARRANVSTATISRVLNDSPLVRPATRQHVRKIIEQLNYVPNTSARYLRIGRTRLFGLIVSDIKNPFFPELIDGFEAMASQEGIDVIFTHTNYDTARLGRCLHRMLDRNVDAIAVMTSEVDIASLERVKKSKVPLVLLNQAALQLKFNNVIVEYSHGFQEAVAHLQRLGHRRIAFIAGPETLESAERRLRAFRDGLKKSGYDARPELIVRGDLHLDGGAAAMQQLLTKRPRPTAVIATNDLMAIGAMRAAQEAGLQVPQELSIIGFDDIQFSAMVAPALTTISLSRQEIATRAFSILFRASSAKRGPGLSTQSILPSLKVRASTAPVSKRTKPAR